MPRVRADITAAKAQAESKAYFLTCLNVDGSVYVFRKSRLFTDSNSKHWGRYQFGDVIFKMENLFFHHRADRRPRDLQKTKACHRFEEKKQSVHCHRSDL